MVSRGCAATPVASRRNHYILLTARPDLVGHGQRIGGGGKLALPQLLTRLCMKGAQGMFIGDAGKDQP